jgi:hypothetical protein
VVLGGIGTLGVIALWAWIFPDLRHANQLSGKVAEIKVAEI